jgi:PIN domain nuclease of toxin-antitoxin system
MPAVVVDTHALVWYLAEPQRLSQRASDALDQASATGEPIYASAISLVEMIYLIEKGRLPQAVMDRLGEALATPDAEVSVVPVDQEVAMAVRAIPRRDVPDLPDRIIAATALRLDLPLVTRDRKIQASQIKSIW